MTYPHRYRDTRPCDGCGRVRPCFWEPTAPGQGLWLCDPCRQQAQVAGEMVNVASAYEGLTRGAEEMGVGNQTIWQGRRIPVVPGAADERLDPYHLLTQPGDYYGPVMGFTHDRPAVFFLLPTATPADPKWGGAPQDGMHHVCCPPHTFIEEPDGTLTIRESIGAGPGGNYYWHGYLTNGRWELSKSKP